MGGFHRNDGLDVAHEAGGRIERQRRLVPVALHAADIERAGAAHHADEQPQGCLLDLVASHLRRQHREVEPDEAGVFTSVADDEPLRIPEIGRRRSLDVGVVTRDVLRMRNGGTEKQGDQKEDASADRMDGAGAVE